MKQIYVLLTLILGVTISMSSCKKDEPVVIDENTSTVKTVSFWVYDYQWSGDEYGYSFYTPISDITQGVMDNGCVLVYMQDVGTSKWLQLPITIPFGSFSSIWFFEWSLGNLELGTWDDDDNTLRPETNQYRVVVFTNITKAVLEQQVDINDYDAVVSFYDAK